MGGVAKIIGIAFLLGSGILGYLAWQEYDDHNKVASAVNESALGGMVQVKKETPKEAIWFGAGAVAALLVGVGLVLKK